MSRKPIRSESVPAVESKTIYPEKFARIVTGQTKRKLGDHFGLANFRVNLTTLLPGSASVLMHHHSKQDEFVYIVAGQLVVQTGDDEYELKPGDCMGFKSGSGVGHQIVNRREQIGSYPEIGDRSVGDQAEFPEDDLQAKQGEDGKWLLTRKNGQPY